MAIRGVPFLRAPHLPFRPTPDVPYSARPTTTSVATSPTSYSDLPPSKTYLRAGILASVLEKAELARSEYPTYISTYLNLDEKAHDNEVRVSMSPC